MTDQQNMTQQDSGSPDTQLGAPMMNNEGINSTSNPVGETKSQMKNGRYINPWTGFITPSKFSVMKFIFWETDNSRVPGKETLDKELPVVTPNHEELKSPPECGVRVTWIGHATVLVQFDGITILTDPVFSQRCAPTQFLGPKRYRNVPCSIHELPKIDAVVISHNHYDHLDLNSVKTLNAKFGAELRWFVPAGLADWMTSAGCDNVIELDWWDENCTQKHPDVKFVFTPAQHWCKRGISDDNKVLWGGWAVIGPKHRFFFPGDTGYCPAFKQIGNKYGPFDLAAIPIGAYEPRWIMKCQHVNPEEAVKIHQDVKAKKSLGIHWGTFGLSYEPYLDPPRKVREAMEAQGLCVDDFFVLKHGEPCLVGDPAGVD